MIFRLDVYSAFLGNGSINLLADSAFTEFTEFEVSVEFKLNFPNFG